MKVRMCNKCGYSGIFSEWYDQNIDAIVLRCPNCGFKWHEHTYERKQAFINYANKKYVLDTSRRGKV